MLELRAISKTWKPVRGASRILLRGVDLQVAAGETVVLPATQITVDDGQGKKLAVLDQGDSLRSLVKGLNALGVSPRDLISILASIKAAGALQAEVVVQ
jgi:flagellar P-ring protein precursor FlgI